MATTTPATTTAAAVYGAARLTVGDLFNVQAAHATYQRLVDVINAQAASMETLLRRVATLETTQRHAVAAQQHALQQMDVAVDQLERLQGQQARMQQTQRQHGVKIDDLVATAASAEQRMGEMKERMGRVERDLDESVKSLREESAPMELFLRLQDDQFAMHDRVAAIDARVETKLDKSEMVRLDGVVATIQAFAPTALQLTSRVTRLEDSVKAVDEARRESAQRVGRTEDRINETRRELQTKVSDADWLEFRETTFKQAVESLQKNTETTDRAVRELVLRGVGLETSYRALSSKLTSVVASIVEELQDHRSKTENILETKLDRGLVETTLEEIRHELGCKAWRRDNAAVATALEEVQNKVKALDRQVALSTRFLDWFTQRGDAYERNLDVVELQLERLAHASAPNQRQPFGGHVRYPQE